MALKPRTRNSQFQLVLGGVSSISLGFCTSYLPCPSVSLKPSPVLLGTNIKEMLLVFTKSSIDKILCKWVLKLMVRE